MTQDLTAITYEGFVAFLFDHPAVLDRGPVGSRPDPWYWCTEVTFDPDAIVTHYLTLFTDPVAVLAPYTEAQLEQGVWAMHSCNLDCSAYELVGNEDLPFERRAALVRAMYPMFRLFFARHELDTSVNMWWDSFAYAWACGTRRRENGGDDCALQDVMFETLCKILDLPEPHIQIAALHGLGHLNHPHTEATINDWLARTVLTDPDIGAYARAAARFDVM